jgi:hypothetical protein
MSLAMNPGDVLSQMSTLFNSIWPILVIGLGFLLANPIVSITKTIFSKADSRITDLGDRARVWNWRRKGWMEKNSYVFTDKMFREYRPKRRRY